MAIQTTATDIHLRSSQAMNLQATTPFSVTVWINATWNPGARTSYVGIYGPTTDTPLGAPVTAMQIGVSTGNYDLTCWTWGGATLVGTATGTMTGFNGVWVFITYTYDGTNHRVFRNGVQLATSTTAQTPGFLNQVYINGFPGGVTSEVGAFQVDQYALYRRALLADEILTIYNAAGARHGIVNENICRYEFDEGADATTVTGVVDLSGNGNTLTPTGAGAAMTYTYPATYANSNIRMVQ
jgi:hypothetical protein